MKILAIETSCDDTCVAILKVKNQKSKVKSFDILSNIVSSQTEIHKKWGGVYPTLAKREHQKNLVSVLSQALKETGMLKNVKCKMQNAKLKYKPVALLPAVCEQWAIAPQLSKIQNLKEILKREEILFKQLKKFLEKYQKPKIDVIAVTVGPGLEPCLWAGVNFAKALAYFWELPIVPVNHIEAHIFANWLSPVSSKLKVKSQKSKLQVKIKSLFPAICLVVSGGHTQLILIKNFGKYEIIGETRDDAAGECFDKTARILGLGYPGGPAIAAEAQKYIGDTYVFLPRPMIYQKNYDFSFSGLKTAVLYKVKGEGFKIKNKKYIQEMCHEAQQAIIDVLITKTIKAALEFRVKTIMLGGGVAANDELRKQFNYKLSTMNYKLNFWVPLKNFCTDNAAMVAIAAHFHWPKGKKPWQKIGAKANLGL